MGLGEFFLICLALPKGLFMRDYSCSSFEVAC